MILWLPDNDLKEKTFFFDKTLQPEDITVLPKDHPLRSKNTLQPEITLLPEDITVLPKDHPLRSKNNLQPEITLLP